MATAPIKPPDGATADPTFMTTIVNMILSGCSMNASTFAMMGKGTPTFQIDGYTVLIEVPEGVYSVTAAYVGQQKLTNPVAVPGFPLLPAPPPMAPDTPPAV